MVKKIYGYLARTINALTKDEDLRQELWLYLLEGNSAFTIIDHYHKISFSRKLPKGRKYGIKKKL